MNKFPGVGRGLLMGSATPPVGNPLQSSSGSTVTEELPVSPTLPELVSYDEGEGSLEKTAQNTVLDQLSSTGMQDNQEISPASAHTGIPPSKEEVMNSQQGDFVDNSTKQGVTDHSEISCEITSATKSSGKENQGISEDKMSELYQEQSICGEKDSKMELSTKDEAGDKTLAENKNKFSSQSQNDEAHVENKDSILQVSNPEEKKEDNLIKVFADIKLENKVEQNKKELPEFSQSSEQTVTGNESGTEIKSGKNVDTPADEKSNVQNLATKPTEGKTKTDSGKVQIAANLNQTSGSNSRPDKSEPALPPSLPNAPGMGILGPPPQGPRPPLLPHLGPQAGPRAGPPSNFPKALPINIPPPPNDVRLPIPKGPLQNPAEILSYLKEIGMKFDQLDVPATNEEDKKSKKQDKKPVQSQQHSQQQLQQQQQKQQQQNKSNTNRDGNWRQKSEVKGQNVNRQQRGPNQSTPQQSRQPMSFQKKTSPQVQNQAQNQVQNQGKSKLGNLTKDELEKEYQWQKFSVERKVKKVLKSLPTQSDEDIVKELLTIVKTNPSKLANFPWPKEQYVVLEKLIEHAILTTDDQQALQKRIAKIINSLQDMHPQSFKEDFKNAMVHEQLEFIQGSSSDFRKKQARAMAHFIGDLHLLSRTSSPEFKSSVHTIVNGSLREWIKGPNLASFDEDSLLLLEVQAECLKEFLSLTLHEEDEALRKQVSSLMKEELFIINKPKPARDILFDALFSLACQRCADGTASVLQMGQSRSTNTSEPQVKESASSHTSAVPGSQPSFSHGKGPLKSSFSPGTEQQEKLLQQKHQHQQLQQQLQQKQPLQQQLQPQAHQQQQQLQQAHQQPQQPKQQQKELQFQQKIPQQQPFNQQQNKPPYPQHNKNISGAAQQRSDSSHQGQALPQQFQPSQQLQAKQLAYQQANTFHASSPEQSVIESPMQQMSVDDVAQMSANLQGSRGQGVDMAQLSALRKLAGAQGGQVPGLMHSFPNAVQPVSAPPTNFVAQNAQQIHNPQMVPNVQSLQNQMENQRFPSQNSQYVQNSQSVHNQQPHQVEPLRFPSHGVRPPSLQSQPHQVETPRFPTHGIRPPSPQSRPGLQNYTMSHPPPQTGGQVDGPFGVGATVNRLRNQSGGSPDVSSHVASQGGMMPLQSAIESMSRESSVVPSSVSQAIPSHHDSHALSIENLREMMQTGNIPSLPTGNLPSVHPSQVMYSQAPSQVMSSQAPSQFSQGQNYSVKFQQEGTPAYDVATSATPWQQAAVESYQDAHLSNTSNPPQGFYSGETMMQPSVPEASASGYYSPSAVSGTFIGHNIVDSGIRGHGYQQNSTDGGGMGQWNAQSQGLKVADKAEIPSQFQSSHSQVPTSQPFVQKQPQNQWQNSAMTSATENDGYQAPATESSGWGSVSPVGKEGLEQQKLGTGAWGNTNQAQGTASWGESSQGRGWTNIPKPQAGPVSPKLHAGTTSPNPYAGKGQANITNEQGDAKSPGGVKAGRYEGSSGSKHLENNPSVHDSYQASNPYILPCKHKEGSPAAEGVSYNSLDEMSGYNISAKNSEEFSPSYIGDGGGYGDSIPRAMPSGMPQGALAVGNFVLMPENRSRRSTSPDHTEKSAIIDCIQADDDDGSRSIHEIQSNLKLREYRANQKVDWNTVCNEASSMDGQMMHKPLAVRGGRGHSRRGQGRGSVLNTPANMPPLPMSHTQARGQIPSSTRYSPRK